MIKKNGFQIHDFEINKKYPKLFENSNFPYIIKVKDMKYFSIILKAITKTKLFGIIFIIKNLNQIKYKNKKFNINKSFLKTQLSLEFIYLYEFYNNNKLFHNLFNLIRMNYKRNMILDNADILEIIYYNIIFTLIEIMNENDNKFLYYNKCSLFNITLDYLIEIISTEIEEKSLVILIKIIDSIYQLILKNKKLLTFLQKGNISNTNNNISLIKINEIKYLSYFIDNKDKEPIIKIKNKINEILYLVYSFNINKIYTNYLLINVRFGFTELKGKKYSKEKIIKSLNQLNNQIESLNDIFLYENKILQESYNDSFMPKRYFVFSKSEKSGIVYDPKMSLTSSNFTIIFSFKQTESEENKAYPLFTLADEREIIFGVYLKNKKIHFYYQKEDENENKTEININKSYLIIIQFNKNNLKNDKFELFINGKKQQLLNFMKTKRNSTIVYIGSLPKEIKKKNEYKDFENSFVGIIGTILFFDNKIEEEDFIDNVFKLQSSYDIMLNLNFYTYFHDDFYNQEINSIKDDIKNYFISISDIIDESILFTLSPLSLIQDFNISSFNCTNYNNNLNFIENINCKNNNNIDKNNLNDFRFSTFEAPFLFKDGTYPVQTMPSIFNFLQNDGFHIIILHFEYFYNILRMLISLNDQKENDNRVKESIYFYINKSICPLFNLLDNIFKQIFNIIHHYKDPIDTLGFTLFKVFKILINKSPLSSELLSNLRQFLLDLNKIYIKSKNNASQKVILNFINHILILICDLKYFDMSNGEDFREHIRIFRKVLKSNQYLTNSETLALILNFSFIFDKKNIMSKNEYKNIISDYKNILMIFISQVKTIQLYLEYIQKVCENKDYSIGMKYKLMKKYYVYNNIKNIFSQETLKEIKEKKLFKIFRKKNNSIRDVIEKEILFNEYKKQLNILIKSQNEIIKEEEKKYLEMLKSIFIQLIYEQSVIIIPSNLNINFLEPNLILSKVEISFFSSDALRNKKLKDNNKLIREEFYSFSFEDNYEVIESNFNNGRLTSIVNTNFIRDNIKHKSIERKTIFDKIKLNDHTPNFKIFGIFDEFINEDDIKLSLYMVKSLFGCLYDIWDKDSKLKFIKDKNDDSYDNYELCFNDFNRFKQTLLFQFLQLVEYIKNLDLFQKFTKLIYCLIKQIIHLYKLKQNDVNLKRVFIHLFENKNIMFYLLDEFLNNNYNVNNNNNLKIFVETATYNLINNLFIFHPKPFIFSFIKNCFKKNKKYVIHIIKNISDFLISDLKNKDNNNNISISYYYFNRLRFICTVKKCFQKYAKHSQLLLLEDNNYLYNIINDLIRELTQSYIIFDSKIYTYNPESLLFIYDEIKEDTSNEEEKKRKKKYIKKIKSSQTKIINTEGILVIILELYLQVIYLLSTYKGDFNNSNKHSNLNILIQNIDKYFCKDSHFLSYYIDMNNEFFIYDQPKKHLNVIRDLSTNIKEMIKNSKVISPEYEKYFIKNPYIEDNRLYSIFILLLFMKYKSMIMDYELNKAIFKSEKESDISKNVKDSFKELIYNSLKDVIDIYRNIKKIKEDKKIDYFLKKEIHNSKSNWTKKIYEEYFQYLSKIIKKTKLDFVSKTFREEVEKKFLKDFEKEQNEKNEKLLKGRISNDNNIFSTANDDNDLYNVNINNIDSIKSNDIINKDYEYQDNFTIIEKTNIKDNYKVNEYNKNNEINNEIEEDKNDNETEDDNFMNDFSDANYQILCTKRDLILTNFGYFFYNDYFYDNNFIKMKKKFGILYPPNLEKNNYNNLEKQMSISFPSTIKNFSNCDLYYPRIFLKPNKHFFGDEFYQVGHFYFNENIIKNINKPIFEYGHGLLNQKNFELFELRNNNNEKENINEINSFLPFYESELLCSNNNFQGYIVIKDNYIIFQSNLSFDLNKYKNDINYILSSKIEEIIQIPKQVIIPFYNINQIIRRNFIFFSQAFEVFCNNGKSYFFNLYKETICDNFFSNITEIKNNERFKNCDFEIIDKPFEYFTKKKYTSKWLDKKISTLEYLLKINKFSGRTYNDLSQYLVLPWTLKDYLNINDKNYIRNFSLPMAVQEKENLEIVKNNYDLENDKNKSYFKCHYSNSSYVTIYLYRINPFTNNQIKLQSGKFDNPHRQIINFQMLCNIFKDHKETCELIPEYYYLIECFLNINYNFFGFLDKKKKIIVNNLKLTNGFDSLLEFFLFHQNFLNSDEISSNIHKWIDNIFGENQFTDKINIINRYPLECYEQYMKKHIEDQINLLIEKNDDKILKREIGNIKAELMMTYLLGQCPGQLFNKPHLQYPVKNTGNIYDKIIYKNEIKNVSNKGLLYMSESNYNINSDNNYFYIVTTKEIFVYTKQMKPISNLCIYNIKKLDSIYSYNIKNENKSSIYKNFDNSIEKEDDNNNKLFSIQYYCKRLIFDIEECKFFFIGGYLDNSYKIYYKNKEKSLYMNIITDSLITCMKYKNKSDIYFTGHISGRIIKWKFNITEKQKESKITILKVSSLLAHKAEVSIIEIHNNLDLLISASDKDGIIFIRKIYDYELLNVIKYNNLNKEIMDINFDKEYLIITYNYKRKLNKKIQKIVTYSVNGIQLSKNKIINQSHNTNNNIENTLLPIFINKNNDDIFMFSINAFSSIKITFKNKIDLFPIDENILANINKGESFEEAYKKKGEFIVKFKYLLKNNMVISYFYDFSKYILFVLFNNGQLFRINLYPIK